jgi:UDP-GlcNAc3NAcA epimerase
MKIVTVIGARPQFIKAAAVSRAISQHNATTHDPQSEIHEVIIHTGQHFDKNMSDVFFEEMQIPAPHYHLNVNSMSHGAMTGRMLEKIEEVLLREKPDYVLVYGDTNSTLAGALAAKKLHIKVVHVEAGLRSFNMRMPEEINRILTDRISDVLCCPTDTAVKNLINEGFMTSSDQRSTSNDQPSVVKTGDVMQDAALFYSAFSAQKSSIIKELELEARDFMLCTIHRAENTDDPARLRNVFEALVEIARNTPIVLPLHPRTRKILDSVISSTGYSVGALSSAVNKQLIIIEPVGYFDMIELLKRTKLVMTDSGGLQKEAYFFCKPCVTLRDETEWVELVENGYNCLAGASKELILESAERMTRRELLPASELYGDGRASMKVIHALYTRAA